MVASPSSVALAGLLLAAAVSMGPSSAADSPRADDPVPLGSSWSEAPVADAYPYFTVFDNAVAAQEGRLVVVSFDRQARPDVSIVLRAPDGTWQGPVVLGQAIDDHAFPAVAIDGAGHVHVVFGGHANADYPIQYVRSMRPYDVTAWTPPEALETTMSSSYSLLAVGPDDRLYLAYRLGGADYGDIVLRSKPAGGPWGPPRTLAATGGESTVPYQLVAEPDGTLHLAFTWRHDRYAPHRDPSYMQSPDGGLTWQTAAGVPLKMPTTRTVARINPDEVTHNPGLRFVRDAEGGLHMLYSQSDVTGAVFQVRHWTFSAVAGKWTPAAGFATSSFPIGFHVHEGSLRVVATAPGDATRASEYMLAPGADAWTVRPLDPVPVRSQLATPTGHNVAIPHEGLPWTVATSLDAGPGPALHVAILQPMG